MKPEEISNLTNLYANLNEQIKQLEQNIRALEAAGKQKTAEYLDLASKEKEANLALMESQLKLKENEGLFLTQLQKSEDALSKQEQKLLKRIDTLKAEKVALEATTGTAEEKAATEKKAATEEKASIETKSSN